MIEKPEAGWTDLLERARTGDRFAFDTLIRSVEEDVMKTALYLTQNLDDAQDVAQEVYVKLVRRLTQVDDPGRFKSWLYRVTVNTARDFHRRRKWWLPLEAVTGWIQPAETGRSARIQGRLLAAMQRLSFRERAAFILGEIHELNSEEAAEVMKCSAVTVRTHLHKARKKLQRELAEFQEEK